MFVIFLYSPILVFTGDAHIWSAIMREIVKYQWIIVDTVFLKLIFSIITADLLKPICPSQ